MASPRQSKEKQPKEIRPQPRLYLVAPAAADIGALKLELMAALDSADVAAVLLRLPQEDERALTNRVKALAPTVQNFGAALIVDGHPGIVARGGADGAHLSGITAFEDVVGSLKPDRIAGAGRLETRHDAMLAAERGADYVMFGEPDENHQRPALEAILERVSWWAEVFQSPCVGYAANAEEVSQLAQAGADFVAVGDFVFSDPRGVGIAVKEAAEKLLLPETA
ncbi:MAG: thiamine phosphate synthase [Pseudorhodoplanes sp.]